MTREEALETIDSIDYFGMSSNHKVELSKNFIEKIYDDFEGRTCSNCKFYHQNYLCLEVRNGDFLPDNDFGCNKWEKKRNEHTNI